MKLQTKEISQARIGDLIADDHWDNKLATKHYGIAEVTGFVMSNSIDTIKLRMRHDNGAEFVTEYFIVNMRDFVIER